MSWRAAIALVLSLLLAVACQALRPPENLVAAEVQRVASGQTLEVTIPSEQPGTIQTVRLLGLDAPDLQQTPWGPAALAGLAAELPPRTAIALEFDTQPRDAFQRRLAYVWRDGTLVNEDLIQRGLVLAATRAPNTRYNQRFAAAQDRARLLGLGIWNPDQPLRQTPGEFRAAAPRPTPSTTAQSAPS